MKRVKDVAIRNLGLCRFDKLKTERLKSSYLNSLDKLGAKVEVNIENSAA